MELELLDAKCSGIGIGLACKELDLELEFLTGIGQFCTILFKKQSFKYALLVHIVVQVVTSIRFVLCIPSLDIHTS